MADAAGTPYVHRLHYRWSQVEADRWGVNVGSPSRPLPSADRTLRLDAAREYANWPAAPSESPFEQARFAVCASAYETIDYNTFCKNGCLKLTEVELFFLSSHLTVASASEWLVVYLGVGNGERFRHLRDTFFPGLSVIAFDPLDERFTGDRAEVARKARMWSGDGTNFTFHVRCFDEEKDAAMIRERLEGRKMLLISDIRGVALLEDGSTFDKAHDQDVQWRVIQFLRPESSLVKFTLPDSNEQFYDYAPAVILKQVFTFYGTCEVRLMIQGVPQQTRRYNGWELYEKMMYHHEHLRGQVYETTRRSDHRQCLDCCFDCTVLWDTVSTYAARNHLDPYKILEGVIDYHVYDPSYHDGWWDAQVESGGRVGPSASRRWWDVEWSLKRGNLMEAIAALEADGEADGEGTDWADIVKGLTAGQPKLVQRLRIALRRPASRSALVQILGRLADPFTLLRTDLNGLIADEGSHTDHGGDQHPHKPSQGAPDASRTPLALLNADPNTLCLTSAADAKDQLCGEECRAAQ
mmetsp:Transcript_109827/g.309679  ORF Transcript_109827/g.309679 Transcript_109827/m.309679 type:complete len:524 (-) Transcript_109827:55-1626(-)